MTPASSAGRWKEETMANYMIHPDEEVRRAIIKLSDALCQWERATGIESVLIVRERGGFVYRACNGKPGIDDDITDSEIVKSVTA